MAAFAILYDNLRDVFFKVLILYPTNVTPALPGTARQGKCAYGASVANTMNLSSIF